MTLANEPKDGLTRLPGAHSQGSRVTTDVATLGLGTTRGFRHVAAVMNAMLVAQAKADGCTVVPSQSA